MQTCSQCNAQSSDAATQCQNCGADLGEFSSTAVALKRFQNNSRVRMIRLIAMHDACPACLEVARTYEKDLAPKLPVEGCSHSLGCRCFYQPYLDEIYP
jgi:hypothetical protein